MEDMNSNAMLDVVHGMEVAAKQLGQSSTETQREAEREKRKIQKALERSNTEAARTYAENTIRKRAASVSLLRLATRLETAAGQLHAAVRRRTVTDPLRRSACGMGKVLRVLDPVRVTSALSEFEAHINGTGLGTVAAVADFGAVEATNVSTIEVESLLEQVAAESEFGADDQMEAVTMFLKKRVGVGLDAGACVKEQEQLPWKHLGVGAL
ncbi:unnamed protein product [Trypanosoma congolense IL3000]|uniref:Uncharacterized protein TCIL3000_11_2840 n=1 Tax=Trypanosoma congolense (strain IL3000) TaxID=1068625 RepID=F9WDB6_TRYCI|nr:unnamed protein product [Trypanosoma congolense IL3000]CCD15269.1 unnamed protein product [Trypanosoma congolense IL3000]